MSQDGSINCRVNQINLLRKSFSAANIQTAELKFMSVRDEHVEALREISKLFCFGVSQNGSYSGCIDEIRGTE